MKMTRQSWTKRAFGVSALAGVCLMQGCAWLGTSDAEEAQEVVPVAADPAGAAGVPPAPPVAEVAPVKLPSVQLTTPYTVGKGDTLTTIAAQYGLRWQDVAGVNPGMNPNKLRIGQVIQLPGKVNVADKKPVKRAAAAAAAPAPTGKTTTYKVRNGDSLSVIAQRYGVKTSAIKAANNLSSDVIRVGQTLKIVGYTKTPAASATPAAPVAVKTQPAKEPTAPAVVEPAVAPVAAEPVVTEVPVTPPPAPAGTLDPAAGATAPAGATPPAATPPTTAPAAAQPETFRLYTVKEGEDLYAVAIRWGVSPNEIKTLNGLTGHELEAGKTIKIPQEKQP